MPLPNLPDRDRTDVEWATESNNSRFVLNTAIGHDSVHKHSSSSSAQINSFDNSPSQVSIIEFGFEEYGISQVSPNESDTVDTSLHEIGSGQISPTQISNLKIGLEQARASQISPSQISLNKSNTTQTTFTQIGSTKVNFNKVRDEEFTITQIDSTQINSIEVFPTAVIVSNVRKSKVPLTRSIPTQQFVDSNNLSFGFHNSIPDIINNLNNTATNIWSNLLQTPTQLDINFQITDLPTGQLAEATITSFDENGTPNAGTIQIDHNANEVGWFVDPTPWENSEFAVVRSL